MLIQNSYYFFQSALTPDMCQKIIELGEKGIEQDKKNHGSSVATTMGYNHKQGDVEEKAKPMADVTYEELRDEKGVSTQDIQKGSFIRDSEISWMNPQWLYDLVWPYLHKANKAAGWGYQFDCAESFQFTKYGKKQFYGWHADGDSDHFGAYKRFIPGVHQKTEKGRFPHGYTENTDFVGKVRKLSMTINLNKPGEYEGGNLKFDFGPHAAGTRYHECTEIRPQGSIIVFPSFVYHQVTPVTSGTRYSLVLWSLGKPFR